MKTNRDIGIDVTRIIAFSSVVGVHFFLNTGFYDATIEGKGMYLMVLIRTFFMICVPLFMIMTGVLYSRNEIDLTKSDLIRFYKKIVKVINTYLVSTLILLCLMKYILEIQIGGVVGLINNILSYAQYSWYVNMYIGFFFLIPFLNKIWYSFEETESRRVLLAICVGLTVLPSVLNGHGWMINRIVPDFWKGLYPITYYYIGSYFSQEVDLKKLPKMKILALLLVTLMVFTIHNIYHSYGVKFVGGLWNDWGGIECVIESTIVFLLINSFDYSNINRKIKIGLSKIANLTFGAYILSFFGDSFIYRILNNSILVVQYKIFYFPLTVGFTIIVSLLLSFLVEKILDLIKLSKGLMFSSRM